ncbi:MAG: DUF389 domain-containing protein [Eubacteriales bacterium]|nr:DUF389 domain-containing protein [Clostridiales bacterium]MDY3072921.1 DUF389 domain-containing protein [Eubacteriales bacterium]MDY3286007.1 DUF389 domain-containing protein [Eubacteriales bacterium]MDY5015576.1 DUF389 domain-containing protein [Eubacteriales bacterium]
MKENAQLREKGALHPLKQFLQTLFDIRGDMMSYEDIDAMMKENTIIHGSNMWILMLAILIASIGLNVNSTAVIIGAMLISPLMSGILTMGYSLAVRDLNMLRRALRRFGAQVVISLLASTLYFWISPLDDPTSEMIARTSPTLWDVLIALFGGIAGIIGNTRRKKGNVIPGVAIATALMPPLCTVGYGIATLQPRFIFGAFYLFFINTLFIALSAALIIVLLGVPKHQTLDPRRQRKINRTVAAITVFTVIPSLLIGAYTVYSSYMEHNISDYLKTEFVFSDTQLVKSSFDMSDKTISVSLVGTPVSDETIARLENALVRYDLDDYSLHVMQNTVLRADEVDATDKITIAIQENTISELNRQLEEQQARLEELESSAAAKLDFGEMARKAESIFPTLTGCCCGVIADESGEYIILAAGMTRNLTPSERAVLENWLKTESGLEQAKLFLSTK